MAQFDSLDCFSEGMIPKPGVLYAAEGSPAEVPAAQACTRDPSLRLKYGCAQDDAERNGRKLHHYPL